MKEFESENRQLKEAEIRNGALAEERDSLRQQVQQSKQVLSYKNKKLNELSIEAIQLKAHVDKLTDESKKNRSQLGEKDKKKSIRWSRNYGRSKRNLKLKDSVAKNSKYRSMRVKNVSLAQIFLLFFRLGQLISLLSVNLTICLWAVAVVVLFCFGLACLFFSLVNERLLTGWAPTPSHTTPIPSPFLGWLHFPCVKSVGSCVQGER